MLKVFYSLFIVFITHYGSSLKFSTIKNHVIKGENNDVINNY